MSAEQNRQLIDRFYTAFAQKDATIMNACYAAHAVFEDPAFGRLNGNEITAMWSMLVEKGGADLTVNHRVTEATHGKAKVEWQATYVFGATSRTVHNKITAEFIIEEDKIVYHRDHFNLWKWSAMALGAPGTLLGWSNFMKRKIQKQARTSLNKYMISQKAG